VRLLATRALPFLCLRLRPLLRTSSLPASGPDAGSRLSQPHPKCGASEKWQEQNASEEQPKDRFPLRVATAKAPAFAVKLCNRQNRSPQPPRRPSRLREPTGARGGPTNGRSDLTAALFYSPPPSIRCDRADFVTASNGWHYERLRRTTKRLMLARDGADAAKQAAQSEAALHPRLERPYLFCQTSN